MHIFYATRRFVRKWKMENRYHDIYTHCSSRNNQTINIYTSASPVTVSQCCPQRFESRDVSREFEYPQDPQNSEYLCGLGHVLYRVSGEAVSRLDTLLPPQFKEAFTCSIDVSSVIVGISTLLSTRPCLELNGLRWSNIL